MDNIFENILGSGANPPRGRAFFDSLRERATTSGGYTRNDCKNWGNFVVSAKHGMKPFFHIACAAFGLPTRARLSISWTLGEGGHSLGCAPRFEGWWHREVSGREYFAVPRWYAAEDTTVYEALRTLCDDALALFPHLASIDSGYTGRAVSRSVIPLPTFYSTLASTRGSHIPLQTLRGAVAPGNTAFVGALKSLAEHLEELELDFIGRQQPGVPPFDLSTIELPKLKFLAISGSYEVSPVGCVSRWKNPKLEYLAVRCKSYIDPSFQPYLSTLKVLTHLHLRGVFMCNALITLGEDVPLLVHLEFDWSDEFPLLEGGRTSPPAEHSDSCPEPSSQRRQRLESPDGVDCRKPKGVMAELTYYSRRGHSWLAQLEATLRLLERLSSRQIGSGGGQSCRSRRLHDPGVLG
ncbi:hypothetical protein M422DRAFT_45672 [Sphaerobolus stellatus SS14]|nr:hypothetical protein M422DRAFT_45672 [Sphaerobolus stellatus SS14]